MYERDAEGIETATIAELVELEGKRVLDVGCGMVSVGGAELRDKPRRALDVREEEGDGSWTRSLVGHRAERTTGSATWLVAGASLPTVGAEVVSGLARSLRASNKEN